jgi:hypothetical protein
MEAASLDFSNREYSVQPGHAFPRGNAQKLKTLQTFAAGQLSRISLFYRAYSRQVFTH